MSYRFGATAAALILIVTIAGSGRTQAAEHPAAECRQYTQNAINQLKTFTAAGCTPAPGLKLWSSDANEHYKWCSTANGDLGQEFKKRRLQIEACNGTHSDANCRDYANKAVIQTQSAIRGGCTGVQKPLWDVSFDNHFRWCRSQVDSDLGAEFKKRRQKIAEFCQAKSNSPTPAPATKAKVFKYCTDISCNSCTRDFARNGACEPTIQCNAGPNGFGCFAYE